MSPLLYADLSIVHRQSEKGDIVLNMNYINLKLYMSYLLVFCLCLLKVV